MSVPAAAVLRIAAFGTVDFAGKKGVDGKPFLRLKLKNKLMKILNP